MMVADAEAKALLFDMALSLVKDESKLEGLSRNILKLAQRGSARRIVDEIEKIMHYEL